MVISHKNNLDHLTAQLSLLNLRLSRQIRQTREARNGDLAEDFRGLLVSDDQVDSIMARGLLTTEPTQLQREQWLEKLEQLRSPITKAVQLANESGITLRLERLRELFDLEPWDVELVTLCLAPDINLGYQYVYAYLQDDVGKKSPTINLALNILCDTLQDRVEKRRRLLFPAPLAKFELVQTLEAPYDKDGPFLSRYLALNPRIVAYLLGSDVIDSRLQPIAELWRCDTSWDDVVLAPETLNSLKGLAESYKGRPDSQPAPVLHLVGPKGVGKRTIAKALASTSGSALLVAECGALLGQGDQPNSSLVALAWREARLQNAVLYWNDFQLLMGEDVSGRAAMAAITAALQDNAWPVILAGEVPWREQEGMEDRPMLRFDLPHPEHDDRKRLWRTNLNGYGCGFPEEEIDLLASKFRFTGGRIRRSVATARDLALRRSNDEGQICTEDLHSAARWHSSHRLDRIAQKVPPGYAWHDLVLPRDQKTQLQEVCGFFRHKQQVYGGWGFQSKSSLGKGLIILFAGPSGTGKTMSAEIMAGELGLDLYKIDLSTVVSKYIGETEKNLDGIFREAQDSNAILFFDEADALFGKRSEVKDAHDRYANIEVSYLLQKMDEYQGIGILTTNFRKNIDDAFVRRLHVVVEFPFPEVEYRLQIWQKSFPSAAPLDASVDLSFMAAQFKIAGGNIKNIAVAAAFLAAKSGTSIGMEQLAWATKREYQKMGKLLVENDFGPYFELIKS